MKRLIIILALLVLVPGALFAELPQATIFNGNYVKTLKQNLNLFDKAHIDTGGNDPTVTATTAPRGSLYLKTSTPSRLFIKLDNGLTSNWATGLTTQTGWRLDGNLGSNSATDFLGTTDAQDLALRTNNVERARLNSTGLGIGVSPTVLLDVNGNARVRALTTAGPVRASANGTLTVTANRLFTSEGGTGLITAGPTRNVLTSDALFNWTSSPVFNSFTASQEVYVQKGGSDTTGDGSPNNPYLTIAKAISVITDATSAKRYAIVVGAGVFAESIVLKDSVSVIGAGSELTRITDISYTAGAGITSRTLIKDLQVPGNLITDTSAADINGINIVLTGVSLTEWDITAGTVGANNNLALAGTFIGTVNVVSGDFIAYNPRSLGDITIANGPFNYAFLVGADVTGTTTLTGQAQLYAGGCLLEGNLVATPAAGNNPVVQLDAVSYPLGAFTSTNATFARYTDAFPVAYVPAIPTNWTLTVPDNVKAALDQLSARGFGVGASTPVSVGSANAVGISTSAARVDHVHQGVHSVNGLFGDATVVAGANITLVTSVANRTITITSTASSGGGSSSSGGVVVFAQSGGTSLMDDFGGPFVFVADTIISTAAIAMKNSGSAGLTGVQFNQYRSGALVTTATANRSATGGIVGGNITVTPTINFLAGDVLTTDIIQTPSGTPEDLSVILNSGSMVGGTGVIAAVGPLVYDSIARSISINASTTATANYVVQRDSVGGISATAGRFGTNAPIVANSAVNFFNGHIQVGQTTPPTTTVNANAGTGATCSVSNATDSAFNLSVTTTAVLSSSGVICDVNFNKTYNAAPVCVFAPTNNNATSNMVLLGIFETSATSKFTVNFSAADVTGRTYTWQVHCLETQ